MSVRQLPVSAPSAEGVDATGVLAFVDALDGAPDIEPHSLMILRHGKLVASGWWAPYAADRPHLLYSLSKSFTSTALALAVGEGLVRLDDPVLSHFPEFEADITDPRSRSMLVRHTASMASGHTEETVDRALALDRQELVRGFLLVPPEQEPGSVFAYNQPATYALAAIVQKLSGQSLTGYLRSRLLDPLGAGDVSWLRDRAGRQLGFSGLHATTDVIARLGQLYLQDGVWEGERLLPPGWVAEATRAHVATPEGGWPDWGQGYGFQFWMGRHGYRGDGAYGQFCLVLPEQDAVIAITSDTDQMQQVLTLAWRHLLPAFTDGPLSGRDDEEAALTERLAGLALAPAPGESVPTKASFTPDGGVRTERPRLTDVEVTEDGRLTLVEDGHRLELRFGGPGWTVTDAPVPAAVSGGWTGPDTLELDVILLETPHHLLLTCSLADGTFTARWRTQPLHNAPLRAMRAPRDSG
ncbi:serine hydrolase domain-containing protein [Streptomyces sp. NPDC090106]|uniref:serine hydrolase domain-containing protein n=1 Tax=Streptomyces sp. NPDC090106 TaxID=3365946 RepID=UPI00380EC040